MDLFASRYGWTKETVHAMPFFDFLGYLAAAREKSREEFRQQLKASAFTGWQIRNLLQSVFAGNKEKKGPTFLEYSEALGLLSSEEKEHLQLFKAMQKLREKQEAKQAIAKAENIIAMDRKNRSKGG